MTGRPGLPATLLTDAERARLGEFSALRGGMVASTEREWLIALPGQIDVRWHHEAARQWEAGYGIGHLDGSRRRQHQHAVRRLERALAGRFPARLGPVPSPAWLLSALLAGFVAAGLLIGALLVAAGVR